MEDAGSDKTPIIEAGECSVSVSTRWLFLILVTSFISIVHYHLLVDRRGWTQTEPKLLARWFEYRGAVAPPEDVVLVKIDERSFADLGISLLNVWPREKLAELLTHLAVYRPRRIAVDLILSDEGDNRQANAELAKALALIPTIIAGPVALSGDPGKLRRPLPLFASSAKLASTSFPVDEGVIRRFKEAGAPLAFAEAAAEIAADESPSEFDFINYYGPSGSITSISASELLLPWSRFSPDFFANKVVVIGVSLPHNAKDHFTTPLRKALMDGVEIHATAIGNILHREWIRRFDLAVETSAYLGVVFLLAFILFSLPPLKAVFVWLLASGTWAALSYAAFLHGRFVPGVLALTVTLPLACAGSIVYYYWITRRSHRQINSAFKCYLAPAMVEVLADDPAKLHLGGEECLATAMFTDIAGFTSLAQSLSAIEVSTMLNRYFSVVGDIILRHEGTLVKFIGDGLYAIWGAPLKVIAPVDHALQSALAIQTEISALTRRGDLPHLQTRIGIHHGKMVVGNLGSATRFDYTAVGDAVNLASRLEQLNKKLGTTTLLSKEAVEQLKGNYSLVPMGTVAVYGRDIGTKICAALEPPLSEEALAHWTKGMSLLEHAALEPAAVEIIIASKLDSRLVSAAELFVRQIRSRSENGVHDWRGTIVFEEK